MSAISDNLIHFLARQDKDSPGKQFEVFKLIIESGLRTGMVLIKFNDGGCVYNQTVCFTDIPLRECNEHTSIYGKFGIGFKKSFVKNSGGNPARYFVDYMPGQVAHSGGVEARGSLYMTLCHQHKLLIKLQDHIKSSNRSPLLNDQGEEVIGVGELNDFTASILYLMSFDKEVGDLGPARDETKEIDLFYKEREWRLVPSHLAQMAGLCGQIDDYYFYKFKRSDVNMIVVPNDEIRSLVLDYFLSQKSSNDPRLKSFGDNPLPIINYDDLHRW